MATNHSITQFGKHEDFKLQLSRGQILGHSHVNKFGRNTNIAIGVEEEIWDGSAAYSYPETALMTSISQTADQAAMQGQTIEIQGLDADWAAVTQNATLDGSDTTTVVALTTPLIRCFRMKVLANVVSDSPIRVHNAGETQDYAIISIGANQTQMAIYTVPVSRTAYMTCYYAHVNPGTNLDPTSMPIRLWARDNGNGYAPQLKHVVGQVSSGFQHFFEPYPAFTEKTDIYMTAQPVGKAADVTAGFDLVVVEN
jgi:hypothetical protein